MKKKNIRIAIVSPFAEESKKISISLSEVLEIPYICGELTDTEFQVIYNKEKKEKYTSNEIYTIILAKFHSRIKAEKTASFISDGTVLNDIVQKKQEIHQKKMLERTFFYRILGAKFREFEKKVEKLIEDYAQTAYDKIYFLKNTDFIPNESSVYFEYSILEILNRKKITYKIIHGDFKSSLHDILSDLNKTFPQK